MPSCFRCDCGFNTCEGVGEVCPECGKKIGTIPVILKNIEPTPIYNMVNTRTGTAISRLTLDFNITEYLKKLAKEQGLKSIPIEKKQFVRVYKDIFNPPHIPYIYLYFTIKNISDYSLKDFSIYFVFDFDINGLVGYDNDISGYDEENDVIYQNFVKEVEVFFNLYANYYSKCGILVPETYINQFDGVVNFSKKELIINLAERLNSNFKLKIALFNDILSLIQYFKRDEQ